MRSPPEPEPLSLDVCACSSHCALPCVWWMGVACLRLCATFSVAPVTLITPSKCHPKAHKFAKCSSGGKMALSELKAQVCWWGGAGLCSPRGVHACSPNPHPEESTPAVFAVYVCWRPARLTHPSCVVLPSLVCPIALVHLILVQEGVQF